MALPLLMVAAGGLQVWGGLQQAEMIREQNRLNQRIADANARYAEMDAWEAEKYGYTQSARYKSIVDATVADQRAAFASENVDVSSGTAAAIQEDTKLIGFLNALDMQDAARKRALGLKVQASNIRLGADFAGSQAEVQAFGATAQGLFGGAKTALSGFSGGSGGAEKVKAPKDPSYSGYGSAGGSYRSTEEIG